MFFYWEKVALIKFLIEFLFLFLTRNIENCYLLYLIDQRYLYHAEESNGRFTSFVD